LAKALPKWNWSAWHVKEGDTVVADQVLADVMTDKATVEIPSPVTCR
jgi:2-oxoisovalerate dehydrogenase E2 component (dihydrolipoyl transacylase)